MLTKDEYDAAIDAHVEAASQMAQLGHTKEALKMTVQLVELAWVLTRPDAEMHHKNIDGMIPDEYRHVIKALNVYVIVDEEGYAVMAWGKGEDTDGNQAIAAKKLPDDAFDRMMAVIDEAIEEHFGHLDLSRVTNWDEAVGKAAKSPITTTHIKLNNERIEEEVEKFSTELDSLFDTWGGGDDSG